MSESAPTTVCHGCEETPVRTTGELVSRMEGIGGRRYYCEQCAAEIERGEWDRDPDDGEGIVSETFNDLRGKNVRAVHHHDVVIITGAEYLEKSRRLLAYEGALREALDALGTCHHVVDLTGEQCRADCLVCRVDRLIRAALRDGEAS